MNIFLKYLVTAVVPQLIALFGSKYIGAEAAGGLGIAVAGAGARVLHLTDSPKK